MRYWKKLRPNIDCERRWAIFERGPTFYSGTFFNSTYRLIIFNRFSDLIDFFLFDHAKYYVWSSRYWFMNEFEFLTNLHQKLEKRLVSIITFANLSEWLNNRVKDVDLVDDKLRKFQADICTVNNADVVFKSHVVFLTMIFRNANQSTIESEAEKKFVIGQYYKQLYNDEKNLSTSRISFNSANATRWCNSQSEKNLLSCGLWWIIYIYQLPFNLWKIFITDELIKSAFHHLIR